MLNGQSLRGNFVTMLASIVMSAMCGHSLAVSSDAIPKAGDLVGKVKKQLDSDHSALGKVSAVLMDVQSSVDKTEQSMLGKVLDLQTARTFFTRHAEIDTANDKMQEEVSKLNTNVEGLSSTVYKVQKEFLANGKKNQASEGTLHAQTVEDKALIESINAELAKGSDVQEALKKLTKIHDNLLAENAEAVEAGKVSEAMLAKQREASRAEVGKHKSLRSQLIAMNNYSMACHTSVEKSSKKLGQALRADSKDNKASSLTMKQKKKANSATEQRLLAERALLITEVKKTEDAEVLELARLKDLREDMRTLENNIVAEVRELEAKINTERGRVKTLRAGLMENVQAQATDLDKKGAVDDQVAGLTKKLHDDENPIMIATTEGQNDALASELREAYALWKAVKTGETKASLNLDQAKAEVAAKTNDLALADEAVRAAREEGEKKLAEAVRIATENKAASQITIEKAQAALAGRCKSKWDALKKKKFAKLRQCERMKESLEMNTAKKDMLMQALKAREMSA